MKARDGQLELDKNVNKTQVVNLAGPLSDQPGFFCHVCSVLLKSSDAFLDHINGRLHQKACGFSMRVERSSLEDVQAKLRQIKEGALGKKRDGESAADYDLQKKLDLVRLEEERAKREKKEQKKAKKQRMEEEASKEFQVDDDTAEQMKAMGFDFQSFGSSSK